MKKINKKERLCIYHLLFQFTSSHNRGDCDSCEFKKNPELALAFLYGKRTNGSSWRAGIKKLEKLSEGLIFFFITNTQKIL